MCFFKLAVQFYLEQNEPSSTLKIMIGSMNSFQKLTQFSEGNIVLHAPASNKYGFLSSDACVSSTYLNRTIWSKETLSLPCKIKLKKVLLSKQTQFSQGINVFEVPASNTEGFLSRDTFISSTQLKRPNRNKHSLSLP
jgi:hypothetical protein